MRVKFCAGWDTTENITDRLVRQFKTCENDLSNIDFVYDENYDIIVFNNYISEEIKKDSKPYIFFHEPSWSGNHQKIFTDYENITIFGHDKNIYSSVDEIVEIPSCMFYGGRGPSSDSLDFWNYNNLSNYDFVKTKSISSVVSSLGNDNDEYPSGCLYKKRVNLIKNIINKCKFVDVFGWGTNGLNQKKDGIIDYKFSICIENSNEKNYISEKFYDCLLTNTIPIYFGCKNIRDFWPENGYILIDDIDDVDNIIKTLNYIFDNCDSLYSNMLPELIKMKKRYFSEFNLLKKINDICGEKKNCMNKTTLVTGLWEIGREQLQDGWSRNFQHYLNKLEDLLKIDCNLIIFGDEELKKFVSERRSETNTQFVTRDLTWFVNNDFYHKIQKIRTNPNWYNQVGWLSESTQAKLEMYNPLVMSKMFLLHDAKILDKFNSDYMFWIDAGISNTVHPGYFTHDNVLEKIKNLTDKFMFICFPYETNSEIHGFELNAINEYSKSRVDRVARAGFFGGKKDSVVDINSIYYHLMKDTLDNGYMGTEESIFTIMTYLHPELIDTFFIDNNGLLGKFFEDVKNDVYINNSKWNSDFFLNKIMDLQPKIEESNQEEVALYVIGFNSPNQFKTLIHSMLSYDKNFIEKPKKYLLDNSTDLSTTEQYLALCKSYGFEHIKKDNIGITGGRQWIAEHFDQSSHKYYFFFEDDMFFSDDKYGHCRNGFGRYVPNLYEKLMGLIKKENFDFIKMNYSEFFGDNGTQWAWYNVPQTFRQSQWPNNQNLPQQGLDPNSPKTKYDSIKSFEGLPYTTGEVFYCNWPQVMSKEGNRKCFINTKFASPYEQTLMSFIFQETVKNEIKPALLLLTPTEHNRFEHYEASLRKEC